MGMNARIRRLVRTQCSHHGRKFNGVRDYCSQSTRSDLRCLIIADENARCPVFEEQVLPLDPELESLYSIYLQARSQGRKLSVKQLGAIADAGKPKVACAKCGRMFARNSNREKYCAVCKPMMRREKQRAYRRRKKMASDR